MKRSVKYNFTIKRTGEELKVKNSKCEIDLTRSKPPAVVNLCKKLISLRKRKIAFQKPKIVFIVRSIIENTSNFLRIKFSKA